MTPSALTLSLVSQLDNIVEVACLNLSVNEALANAQNELTEERRVNMAKIFAKRNSHISLFFNSSFYTRIRRTHGPSISLHYHALLC